MSSSCFHQQRFLYWILYLIINFYISTFLWKVNFSITVTKTQINYLPEDNLNVMCMDKHININHTFCLIILNKIIIRHYYFNAIDWWKLNHMGFYQSSKNIWEEINSQIQNYSLYLNVLNIKPPKRCSKKQLFDLLNNSAESGAFHCFFRMKSDSRKAKFNVTEIKLVMSSLPFFLTVIYFRICNAKNIIRFFQN